MSDTGEDDLRFRRLADFLQEVLQQKYGTKPPVELVPYHGSTDLVFEIHKERQAHPPEGPWERRANTDTHSSVPIANPSASDARRRIVIVHPSKANPIPSTSNARQSMSKQYYPCPEKTSDAGESSWREIPPDSLERPAEQAEPSAERGVNCIELIAKSLTFLPHSNRRAQSPKLPWDGYDNADYDPSQPRAPLSTQNTCASMPSTPPSMPNVPPSMQNVHPSMSDASNHIYKPLGEGRRIRILVVQPAGTLDEPIRCRMEELDLPETPSDMNSYPLEAESESACACSQHEPNSTVTPSISPRIVQKRPRNGTADRLEGTRQHSGAPSTTMHGKQHALDDSVAALTRQAHHGAIPKESAYAALSYSWAMDDGDVSKSKIIELEGHPFAVTENLLDALRRLRSHDELRVWADAVCINQSNIEEKSHQVAMMGQIYRAARVVVAWLGESGSDARDEAAYIAMHCLCADAAMWQFWSSQLGTRHTPGIRAWGHGIPSKQYEDISSRTFAFRHTWAEYSLPQVRLDDRRAVESDPCPVCTPGVETQMNLIKSASDLDLLLAEADQCEAPGLLERRYFQRRWVVQEINVPDEANVCFFWGSRYMWKGNFAIAARRYRDLVCTRRTGLVDPPALDLDLGIEEERQSGGGWSFVESKHGDYEWVQDCDRGIVDGLSQPRHRLIGVTLMRPKQGIGAILESATSFLRCKPGSSLAGLLEATKHMECSDPRDLIYSLVALCSPQYSMRADYSCSVAETFTTFAGLLIGLGRADLLLSQCSGVKGSHGQHIPGLPSWVPDLRNAFDVPGEEWEWKREECEATHIQDGVLSISLYQIGVVGRGVTDRQQNAYHISRQPKDAFPRSVRLCVSSRDEQVVASDSWLVSPSATDGISGTHDMASDLCVNGVSLERAPNWWQVADVVCVLSDHKSDLPGGGNFRRNNYYILRPVQNVGQEGYMAVAGECWTMKELSMLRPTLTRFKIV